MSKRELNSNDENLEPSYSLNSEKNTILFEDENWEAAKSYSVNGIFQNPVDATQAGYDGRNMQEELFDVVGVETLRKVLSGQNSTIYSYGQTGAGKSFTVIGDISSKGGITEDRDYSSFEFEGEFWQFLQKLNFSELTFQAFIRGFCTF